MLSPTLTRALSHVQHLARLRPAVTAAALMAVVGLTVGCAYAGGAAVQAAGVRAQAQKIDGIAAQGFTEEAYAEAAGGLDESALAIARRHDPYTVAGGDQRDAQSERLAARLERLRGPTGSASTFAARGAQPFHLAGALGQSRDLDCLTQAAYYEARGEGRDGMRAVVQVVLNRARHAAFPRSICGVVFQGSNRSTGCQFSFTCNGAMRAPVQQVAWARAREVASAALSGQVYAPVGNATFFHTTNVAPGWRNSMVRVNQVGSHIFYRYGGRSGDSGAFTYAVQPSRGAQPQLIRGRDEAPQRNAQTEPQQSGEVAYTQAVAEAATPNAANITPAASAQSVTLAPRNTPTT